MGSCCRSGRLKRSAERYYVSRVGIGGHRWCVYHRRLLRKQCVVAVLTLHSGAAIVTGRLVSELCGHGRKHGKATLLTLRLVDRKRSERFQIKRRCHQGLGIGLLRVVHDLMCGSAFDNLAFTHHDDVVTQGSDDFQIVADEQVGKLMFRL